MIRLRASAGGRNKVCFPFIGLISKLHEPMLREQAAGCQCHLWLIRFMHHFRIDPKKELPLRHELPIFARLSSFAKATGDKPFHDGV
jgi:hypothetical protein